jgi:hypothetical protein
MEPTASAITLYPASHQYALPTDPAVHVRRLPSPEIQCERIDLHWGTALEFGSTRFDEAGAG